MAWNSLGSIAVVEGWAFFPALPDNAVVIRLAAGTVNRFCWIGFFRSTSTQEVLNLRAFKAGGKWRVYDIPQVLGPLRVGAVLPRPGRRFPQPESFGLTCAYWTDPDPP